MTGTNWVGGSKNRHKRMGEKSRYQPQHHRQHPDHQFGNRIINNAIQGIRKHGMKKPRQNHHHRKPNFDFAWATEDKDDLIEESETRPDPIVQYQRKNDEGKLRQKVLNQQNDELLRRLGVSTSTSSNPIRLNSKVSQILAINDWSGTKLELPPTTSVQDRFPLDRSVFHPISPISKRINPFESKRDTPPHLSVSHSSTFLKNDFESRDDQSISSDYSQIGDHPSIVEKDIRDDEVPIGWESNLRVEDEEENYHSDDRTSFEQGEILEFNSSPPPIAPSPSREDFDIFDDFDANQSIPDFDATQSIPASYLASPSIVPNVDLPLETSSTYSTQPKPIQSTTTSMSFSSTLPVENREPTIEESYYGALAASMIDFGPLSPNFFAAKDVDWSSVCSLTSVQRNELSRSWKFENGLERIEILENGLEDGTVLLGERMGIGSMGIELNDYGRFDAILKGASSDTTQKEEKQVESAHTESNNSRLDSLANSDIQQDLPLQPSSTSSTSASKLRVDADLTTFQPLTFASTTLSPVKSYLTEPNSPHESQKLATNSDSLPDLTIPLESSIDDIDSSNVEEDILVDKDSTLAEARKRSS